jgi:hypothetical protein
MTKRRPPVDRDHLIKWIKDHVPLYFNYGAAVSYTWNPEALADDMIAYAIRSEPAEPKRKWRPPLFLDQAG